MKPKERFLALLVILLSVTAVSTPISAGEGPVLSLTFAVDASGSMRGDNIKQVRESIATVVENLTTATEYSVISFSNKPKILISKTSQSSDVTQSLKELKPGGQTALYDGLQVALKNTENSENSVVIVFSDGEDNSSTSTNLEARNSIDSFAGLVVLVGLGNSADLATRLTEIAGSRGQVISVLSTLALTEKLDLIIQPAIVNKLKVTPTTDTADDKNSFLGLFALLAVSLFISFLAAVIIIRQRVAQKGRMQFLKAYDNKRDEIKDKSIFIKLLRVPIFSKYVVGEEKRLMVAGVKVGIQNWIYIQLALFIGVGFVLQIAGFSGLLALIFSGAGSFGVCSSYLRVKRSKKITAFSNELPDILTIIASSLKSGLSFTQAMTSVAQESEGEASLQFRRVLAEVQMGRNLTDALEDVADRMDSQDFRWTISALGIQREVGGNLSEILTTTSETIRGRAEIRNEIRALSAEGRMSAYVLVALPLIMLLYLRVTRPESFNLLFSTTPGLVMMTVVLILMTIGWFWVQKVVKIKLT